MSKQGGSTNILNALVENRIREIVREEMAAFDRARLSRPTIPLVTLQEVEDYLAPALPPAESKLRADLERPDEDPTHLAAGGRDA